MFVAALLMAFAFTVGMSGKGMKECVSVPLQQSSSHSGKDRPRSPEQPLFRVYLDTDLTLLFISALYDVDEVSVCIENLSSGEYVSYSFDSSELEKVKVN